MVKKLGIGSKDEANLGLFKLEVTAADGHSKPIKSHT